VIDKNVDQWRIWLCACVKAKAGHYYFDYLPYTSADFRHDLTGFLETLKDFRGRLQNHSLFEVNVFSGSVAT